MHGDQIKGNYQNMKPAVVRLLLETYAQNYKSMSDSKKGKVY